MLERGAEIDLSKLKFKAFGKGGLQCDVEVIERLQDCDQRADRELFSQ